MPAPIEHVPDTRAVQRTVGLGIALSPYELVGRTPAATFALIIADDLLGVATLRPGPFLDASPDSARAAAERIPAFAMLMEHWAWTGELWGGGILAAHHGAESPLDHARRAAQRQAGQRWAGAALVDSTLLEDEDRFIDAMSRDLLRGGGDPALSFPVREGMMSFALATGRTWVTSADPRSRRSPSAGACRFTMALPRRCSACIVIALRSQLSEELAEVRAVLSAAVGTAEHSGPSIERAARRYNSAFRDLASSCDDQTSEEAVRPLIVSVTISGSLASEPAADRAQPIGLRRMMVKTSPFDSVA